MLAEQTKRKLLRMPNSHWKDGRIETPTGSVPRLRNGLAIQDWLGAFKARWMINRTRYFIPAGLYAAGSPDRKSPVLVTANYKLTIDALRREITGRDLWVLVLDTRGINVWCAAGKGTFGTDELVNRIAEAGLAEVVEHHSLILPQLGAPGVAAHEVRKRSGFNVIYGPVRASDLARFLDRGLEVTPEMRRVTFPFDRRIVLIPVELLTALKYGLLACLCLLIAGGIGREGYDTQRALNQGLVAAAYLGAGIAGGTILVPALLPWLPGRAFSAKGLAAGTGLTGLLIVFFPSFMLFSANPLTTLSLIAVALAVASFTGMNFTGSSTYTSLSGVRREMRRAVPLQFGAAILGLAAWMVARFWSF